MIQTGIGSQLRAGPDFAPWVAGIKADVPRGGPTLTPGPRDHSIRAAAE
jgi:hypothetical protein